MAKFIAEDSFWNLFPQAQLGIIIFKGIDNHSKNNEEIDALLAQANQEAKKFLGASQLSKNPVIAVWREAFKKFRTKKGARCSIEALLKRVDKNKPVGSINPLVDIYNAVSLTYGLPCGAEDIDTFKGDMRLGISEEGGDEFIPLGEDSSPTLPGELCYRDDQGAVCRCFNWRDGERTMIREDTQNVFAIMESVDPEREEDLRAALNFLEEKILTYCGGESRQAFLTIDQPEVEL